MREPKVYCFALFLVIHSLWLEKAFAQDKLTQAETAFQRRDYTRAETLCKEFIDETTDETASAKAHDLLSQIYMKSVSNNARFFSNIETNLKKATEKDSSNHIYRLHLAEYYESRQNNDAAAAQYEKIVDLGHGDETILRWLIEYYEPKQDHDKLLRYYRRLLGLKPSDSKAYYRTGMLLREIGDSENAKDTFNKAILADGENWDAYVELGELYEFEGKYELANQAFEKAKTVRPKARESWERTTKNKTSHDFIQSTLQTTDQVLKGGKIPELARIHTQLDSLKELHPLNQDIKLKLHEVRKSLCDLWFQRAQSAYANGQMQSASSAFDSSFSYADDEADKNRARTGSSTAQAELGVQRRVEAVQTEAEKALKERKLKEAQQGFIAVSVFDPRRRSTLSEKQKRADIESWYVLGLVAKDSSQWEDAKFSFSQVMKLDSAFLDTRTRYREAKDQLIRQQRIEFLQKMADSTYNKENWAIANFALNEMNSITPGDQTVLSKLVQTEKKLRTTKTIRRILTFWAVLSLAVMVMMAIKLFRSASQKSTRAEAKHFASNPGWMKP